MTQVQRRAVRGAAMVAGLVLATALVGCGNFFVCDKASCTTSGSGGSTGPAGNVAYVGNNVSASTSINGYSLAKPTLTATTSSPYPINLTPTAMVMSHNNGFLYVSSALTTASPAVAGIYGFTVGTGGALAVLNVGNAMASLTSVAAMDVSPDGNWLIVATSNDGANAVTITAYALNATTGLVGAGITLPYTPPMGSIVSAVKVAPSGLFISVALGTGGVYTFPFTTSTGLIGKDLVAATFSTGGAYDVAIDGNNYLYVAATGKVFAYAVSSSSGVLTITPVTTAGTTTEAGGPFSIALDGTSYLYASASDGAATPTYLIYEFSIKNGVLTPLTSSATISAPTLTTKLGVDSTGAYLLAAGYDSSAGLKMYGITSGTGVLTSLDTAPTGTSTAVSTALALSH